MRIQSLGREDPLKKEMATHPSILAWKIPWTEKPGRLHSMGSKRVGHTERLRFHVHQPGEFIIQCTIFLPFCMVHGVLKARIMKWFAIPFSIGPHSVRT